ncbi:MAG: hypothetical protein JZU70_09330 [Chlorobium sp.]|nr:hypothetical protein [Chlorobium sp.]
MIILGQIKRHEEREFYLQMAIRKRWSKRELERQFRSALFDHSLDTLLPAPALTSSSLPVPGRPRNSSITGLRTNSQGERGCAAILASASAFTLNLSLLRSKHS